MTYKGTCRGQDHDSGLHRNFFPWRKATGLDIAFKLRGDYAPKKLDFDPDEGVPIKVINLGGIPRHNA